MSQGSSWAFEMTDEKCVCTHHLVNTPHTLFSHPAHPTLPWPASAQLGPLHPAHRCISSINPPLNSISSPVSHLRKISHPSQAHCHASECQFTPRPLLSPLPSPAPCRGPQRSSAPCRRGEMSQPSARESCHLSVSPPPRPGCSQQGREQNFTLSPEGG